MVQIIGYCPSPNNFPIQTEKAVRVTVTHADGYDTPNADTCWLPRSIAKGLKVTKTVEQGVSVFTVTAIVPQWWTDKLDNRPTWQKRGMSTPPMAQRPW